MVAMIALLFVTQLISIGTLQPVYACGCCGKKQESPRNIQVQVEDAQTSPKPESRLVRDAGINTKSAPVRNDDFSLAAFFNDGQDDLQMLTKDNDGNFEEVAPEIALAGVDVIAIYFSAHWCPPCRGFTPELTAQYAEWKKQGDKVEVVFVSSDQDEGQLQAYFKKMGNWVSYKHGDGKHLSKKYEIQGIPSLVVINARTGETITKNGRAEVGNHKEKTVTEWIKATQ